MISFGSIMLFIISLCGLQALRIGGSPWKVPSAQTGHTKEAASLAQRVGSSFRSSSQWLKGLCNSESAHHSRNSLTCMSMMDTQQSLLETIPSATIPLYQQRLHKHENLVEGKLDNGLSYVILPNAVPAGRFEAHLEILSGSAKELDHQQGMAHLLEHVAYMGSPKRQLISGTGSRTNAYTDFHHTVFFASCPTQTPDQFWKRPMLPMALDALLDVMTVRVDDHRLNKERAAVLSEASMVNKMEYRVECQILSALHEENRISTRFPIGKEHLIKIWTKEDLQLYHDTHYRPDNSVLFIVGDLDVDSTIATIQSKFGALRAKTDAKTYLRNSMEFPVHNMRDVSPHFPPVTHKWSCTEEEVLKLLPVSLLKPVHKGGVGMMSPADRAAAVSSSLPDSNYDTTLLELPVDQLDAHLLPLLTQSTPIADTTPALTTLTTPTTPAVVSPYLPNLKLFQHELLQSFSFHLFAKRPIEPITTASALRRDLMRRMVLSALQIRLNVQQRQDPLFTFADFNQMNWPREGCAVCSLDLTTDTNTWKEAVSVAVQEIRRLGLYGLTVSELRRYGASMLGEVAQIAAQADQQPHEELVAELMESRGNGHTFLHPLQRHLLSTSLLAGITLSEVNAVARELCEHLSHIEVEKGVLPAAVVACAPLVDRAGATFSVSEQEIASVIEEALRVPLHPLQDKAVPTSLLTAEQVAQKVRDTQPAFVSAVGGSVVSVNSGSSTVGAAMDTTMDTTTTTTKLILPNSLGVVQAQLSNGMKVNMKSLSTESQRVSVRLYVPGGRLLERPGSPGEVALGARTMQEGGAFASMSREDVELFCIDNQVMVEVTANDEALILDFESLTTKAADDNSATSGSTTTAQGVTGTEAIMQVAHIILTDFTFEQDAFERAKQGMREQFETTVKGLESACTESLVYNLTNADPRFLVPNHLQIDALTLPTVRSAITAQLRPNHVEVSVCGDVPLQEMQGLVLKYLGTVPANGSGSGGGDSAVSGAAGAATVTTTANSAGTEATTGTTTTGSTTTPTTANTPPPSLLTTPVTLPVRTLGGSSQLGVYLQDNQDRAMGYLAGPAPNSWGRLGSGGTLYDRFVNYNTDSAGVSCAGVGGAGVGVSDKDKGAGSVSEYCAISGRGSKWKDPLFGHAALLILQEVANRRLFSVVREERQLTYDASFTLQHRDVLEGSWYTVAVTSSPAQVQSALTACREALNSLTGRGLSTDTVQSAKRTLLNKFHTDRLTNKFWVEKLSGTQSAAAKDKTVRSIELFAEVLQEVSTQDVQFLVDVMAFTDDNMTACVGVTAPEPPAGM